MSEEKDKKRKKKDFSKNFVSGVDFLDRPRDIIKVSPTLDSILGGGIPSGSWVVMTGKPKLGKTTMCLHIAAKAQKLGYKIYYSNIEGRIKPRDLEGITGLDFKDTKKFEMIDSVSGNILDGEDYLDILMEKVRTEQKCVFIEDSVSQLCSSGRKEGSVGDRFRDDMPAMLASVTKQACNILPITNNILIFITHIIANQGGHGPAQSVEASGFKIQYQADVKLKATYKEDYSVGETSLGQLVHWQCDTSALGPPNGKTVSLLRYGEGIDEYYDLLSVCCDIGLVTKAGSWISMPDGQKVQGMEKARTYLKENPKVYQLLIEKFNEMIS
jgi:recombination protein RecA